MPKKLESCVRQVKAREGHASHPVNAWAVCQAAMKKGKSGKKGR